MVGLESSVLPCSLHSFVDKRNERPLFPFVSRRDRRGLTRGQGWQLCWDSVFYECACKMLQEGPAAACGTRNASALGDAEQVGSCRVAAAASTQSRQWYIDTIAALPLCLGWDWRCRKPGYKSLLLVMVPLGGGCFSLSTSPHLKGSYYLIITELELLM